MHMMIESNKETRCLDIEADNFTDKSTDVCLLNNYQALVLSYLHLIILIYILL